jgi:hypothetical protein
VPWERSAPPPGWTFFQEAQARRWIIPNVSKGRWRSWLSHLSNTFHNVTQKVPSSILGRLIVILSPDSAKDRNAGPVPG